MKVRGGRAPLSAAMAPGLNPDADTEVLLGRFGLRRARRRSPSLPRRLGLDLRILSRCGEEWVSAARVLMSGS